MTRRWLPVVVIFVGGLLGLAVAGFPSRHRDAPLTVRSAPSTTTASPTSAPVLDPTSTLRAPAPSITVRATADVRVMAVNASSVPGSAGRVGARIKAMGWNVMPPGPDRRTQDTAIVMYRAGYDNEARVLATALGLDPGGIATGDAAATSAGEADLAVVIGDDLARRTS